MDNVMGHDNICSVVLQHWIEHEIGLRALVVRTLLKWIGSLFD
jgi:hypothetical protein